MNQNCKAKIVDDNCRWKLQSWIAKLTFKEKLQCKNTIHKCREKSNAKNQCKMQCKNAMQKCNVKMQCKNAMQKCNAKTQCKNAMQISKCRYAMQI